MRNSEGDGSFVSSDCSDDPSSESGSPPELSSGSEDLDYQGPRRGPVIFYKLTYSESQGGRRRNRRRRLSPDPRYSPEDRTREKRREVKRRKPTKAEIEKRNMKLYLEHMNMGNQALNNGDKKNAMLCFEKALEIAEKDDTIDQETVLARIASAAAPSARFIPDLPPQDDYVAVEDNHDYEYNYAPPTPPRVPDPADSHPQGSNQFARTAEQIFAEENNDKLVTLLVKSGIQADRVTPEMWAKLVHQKYKQLKADKRKHYELQAAQEAK
jgi:hypothetical protein